MMFAGVDCLPLACAFKDVIGSGRDFFASALTGAFKADEQLQEGLVRSFTAACKASRIPIYSQFLGNFQMHKLNALPSLMRSVHLVIAVISCDFHVVVVEIGPGVDLMIHVICTILIDFPSLILTLASYGICLYLH